LFQGFQVGQPAGVEIGLYGESFAILSSFAYDSGALGTLAIRPLQDAGTGA
jgi:hypothetical protein